MSRKPPAIPAIANVPEPVAKVLEPLKQNVEFMNGTRTTKIPKLGTGATLSDVINKVNDLIDRAQGEK